MRREEERKRMIDYLPSLLPSLPHSLTPSFTSLFLNYLSLAHSFSQSFTHSLIYCIITTLVTSFPCSLTFSFSFSLSHFPFTPSLSNHSFLQPFYTIFPLHYFCCIPPSTFAPSPFLTFSFPVLLSFI